VVVIQTTSPLFCAQIIWCINKTVMQVFLHRCIMPMFLRLRMGLYHCHQRFLNYFNTVNRKLENLLILQLSIRKFNFSEDMLSKTSKSNWLENQILVRYLMKNGENYNNSRRTFFKSIAASLLIICLMLVKKKAIRLMIRLSVPIISDINWEYKISQTNKEILWFRT
jgi:hypothetical protein